MRVIAHALGFWWLQLWLHPGLVVVIAWPPAGAVPGQGRLATHSCCMSAAPGPRRPATAQERPPALRAPCTCMPRCCRNPRRPPTSMAKSSRATRAPMWSSPPNDRISRTVSTRTPLSRMTCTGAGQAPRAWQSPCFHPRHELRRGCVLPDPNLLPTQAPPVHTPWPARRPAPSLPTHPPNPSKCQGPPPRCQLTLRNSACALRAASRFTGFSYSEARGCRPPICSDIPSGSHTMQISALSFSLSCTACRPQGRQMRAVGWRNCMH